MSRTEDTIGSRFGRSAQTYDEAATVQRDVAHRLTEMARPHLTMGGTLMEVGCGTGMLTLPLVEVMRPSHVTLCDISPEMTATTLKKMAGQTTIATPLVADAETVAWPQVDVVASASAVQWFASPLTFADKATNTLSHNGLLILATYGPQTYRELRDMTPNAYPTFEAWQSKLTERFDILESAHETSVQTFGCHTDRLRHIVLTGVGGKHGNGRAKVAISPTPPTLTYETLFFVARLRD